MSRKVLNILQGGYSNEKLMHIKMSNEYEGTVCIALELILWIHIKWKLRIQKIKNLNNWIWYNEKFIYNENQFNIS